MDYREFLIKLANKLDEEGKHKLADTIGENFEEFLELLEKGKLDFSFLFHGRRDSNGPYSNRGREVPIYGISN